MEAELQLGKEESFLQSWTKSATNWKTLLYQNQWHVIEIILYGGKQMGRWKDGKKHAEVCKTIIKSPPKRPYIHNKTFNHLPFFVN